MTHGNYNYDTPIIVDDIVLWSKSVPLSGGLYAYNINNGKETQVYHYDEYSEVPYFYDFDGQNVVFYAYGTDSDTDIYMLTIGGNSNKWMTLGIITIFVVSIIVILVIITKRKPRPLPPPPPD